MSKYGVFSRPYFPLFGLNTEIRTRKNFLLGHFSRSVNQVIIVHKIRCYLYSTLLMRVASKTMRYSGLETFCKILISIVLFSNKIKKNKINENNFRIRVFLLLICVINICLFLNFLIQLD